ncbi:MAG: hypothetical protein ACHP84_00455 [Caulobacterales bacterium]
MAPSPVCASSAVERRLNRDCFCIDVNGDAVWRALDKLVATVAPSGAMALRRTGLFSSVPAFVAQADLTAMSEVARAIEAVAQLASFQSAALDWAPPIARADLGPRGAFMGYDFHLSPAGPKLIEVNTNAGGAFLNALLAQGQVACCPEVQTATQPHSLDHFEDAVWRMFQAEWSLQGRRGEPRAVAIVDDAPEGQFLYPEFLLAKAFFERRGVAAVIVDPRELRVCRGRLMAGDLAIDLVYNRLVDFAFEGPHAAILRQAYLADAAVVTPNPRNHALMADKRNLTLLSDPEALDALGVDAALRESLARIPRSRRVTADNADALWEDRKSLFFKPSSGHAGKAVYRGDKITKRVWASILGGDYVAQDLEPPSERWVKVDGDPQARKMDVRLYTYAGDTILTAARLYRGQTTNFRTPGGGFAPVIALGDPSAES